MNKLTGHKRTHDCSDEEQVRPPVALHPRPPLNTSRCTVKAIPGHQSHLQAPPPEFPGEPLNQCLGVWGWLPASMVEEFRGKHYAPFMQAPPAAPDPLPASHTPPDLIAQPTDTGNETDAQLLEQLEQACDAQVLWTGRTNAAVKLLNEPKPLNERVTLLMNENETGSKLAQHLLSLLDYCKNDARAHGFVMSLFLAMRRVPNAQHHRMSFIDNLPPKLSPELQCHAPAIQDYWVGVANGQRGKEETRELARAVCKHFGW